MGIYLLEAVIVQHTCMETLRGLYDLLFGQ